MPPVKADSWISQLGEPFKMANAAPRLAPEDTPRMSGETSGLREHPLICGACYRQGRANEYGR